MDSKTKNYFNRLSEKPEYLPDQVIARRLLARAKKFIPLKEIYNHHFQLHHSFKALTPNTFLYSTKTHLEMLNVPNLKKTVALECKDVTSVDCYINLVACAHAGRHISLVNLESPNIEVKKFYLNMEQELINHVKLYNDPVHGLRLVCGGNDKAIKIFDVNGSTEPCQTIKVDSFVNHFTLDPKNGRIMMAYDATEVDIYDLNTGER